MDFRDMIQHLIFARKRSIALAANAIRSGTPEHSLLSCMRTIIVSIEVVPTAESSLATFILFGGIHSRILLALRQHVRNLTDCGCTQVAA
jgi:hypothetical protein